MAGDGHTSDLRRIAQRVRTITGPNARHRALAEEAVRLSGADSAMFLGVVTDGAVMHHGDHSVGVGDSDFMRRIGQLPGTPYRPPYDPRSPPRAQVGRWADIEDACPGPRQDYPILRGVYSPLGLVDQQRLLLYDGDTFFGWFGTLHREPVGRRARRRLRMLFDAFYDTACATERLAAAGSADLPDGHLLFDANGRLVGTGVGCEPWSERSRRADLASRVRRFDGGGPGLATVVRKQITLVRLDGADGVRYLARVAPARRPALSPLARLTGRQREVVELVVAGLRVREAATELGVRASTVRAHLKEAYRRLHVSNRAELARLAEASPSSAAERA